MNLDVTLDGGQKRKEVILAAINAQFKIKRGGNNEAFEFLPHTSSNRRVRIASLRSGWAGVEWASLQFEFYRCT
jgi:hypothetical protein